MLWIKIVFWIVALLIFYIYFGYPFLLGLISLLRKKQLKINNAYEPTASLIIAAFNEEISIKKKIENSLKLDYPVDKLEIIIFSDASTDKTDDIVRGFADMGVKLLRIEGRKGKTFCQNEAVNMATGDVLVFSDANSMYQLDAIKKLVRHFVDPNVGCVSGELQYQSGPESVKGESSYWRYEQLLKRLETRISSVVSANGAIYAVGRNCYVPLPADVISDFVEPLELIRNGYRVVYEPESIATETTAADSEREFQRRVRIVTRSVQSLLRYMSLLSLLNPLQNGVFSLQLLSHKVLRWLSGVFLLLTFALNIFLVGQGPIYTITISCQLLFYLLASWGYISEVRLKQKAPKIPHISYYFCLSCYAMLKGISHALSGKIIVTWKTNR